MNDATKKAACEIVNIAADTWAAALVERDAFIASVRAAGGRCKIAKNASGMTGKCVTGSCPGGCDHFNHSRRYITWVRVEVA